MPGGLKTMQELIQPRVIRRFNTDKETETEEGSGSLTSICTQSPGDPVKMQI